MISPVKIELGTTGVLVWCSLLSKLIWHVLTGGSLNCLLFMHHLILGLRWFVVRINRAWLYWDSNVSSLQVNTKLVQKGEYQTKIPEVPISIILLLDYILNIIKPRLSILVISSYENTKRYAGEWNYETCYVLFYMSSYFVL